MAKPLINISPLGSIYVLGIPLNGSVEYARKELAELNVQENQNCIYIENIIINSDLPIIGTIIFSKSKELACRGRIDRIHINASKLNINECEHLWKYFKSKLKEMNLTYTQEDEGNTCSLKYETKLCQIKLFKQFGVNTNPNICPFGIIITSKYLHQDEYNRNLINSLFHDKIEYTSSMKERPKVKRVIMGFILLILGIGMGVGLTLLVQSRVPKDAKSEKGVLPEYVYIDRMNIIHCNRKCSRLNYKGMKSERCKVYDLEVGRDYSFCPKCVGDISYEYLSDALRRKSGKKSLGIDWDE